MSIDKDSTDEKELPPVERPPAVSERIWALIPNAQRGDYIRAAALGLRRGIHPETAIVDKLEADGACSFDAIEAALGNAEGSDVETAPPEPSSQKNPVPADEGMGGSARRTRSPVWPFGTAGYLRSEIPRGEIGSILQHDMGFDGPTSSEIEWLILRAISRDPVFVLADPSNLRLLGCDLPADILSAAWTAITFECECVISDVRRRQAAGDPSSLTWIDPETFVL